MIEETIVDSLGSTIELIYDVGSDTVKVKNSSVDTDFREVRIMEMWRPNIVLELETLNGGDDGWKDYSDENVRSRIRLFWETNKINKD
jgi:hypothetical protein